MSPKWKVMTDQPLADQFIEIRSSQQLSSSFVQAAVWEELENKMQVWTWDDTFFHCFTHSTEGSAATVQSFSFAGCMSEIMKGD